MSGGIGTMCSVCWCRLPYSLIVGLFFGSLMVPVAVFHAIADSLVAVVWLPHDCFFTARALLLTKSIGVNLKVLAFILLPICLVAWPAFVLVAILIAAVPTSVGYPVVKSTEYVVDHGIPECGLAVVKAARATGKVVEDTFKYIKDFWNFSGNSYFAYLDDFSASTPHRRADGTYEAPFDVPLLDILVGFVSATVCIVVEVSLCAIICVARFPLMLARVWHDILVHFWEVDPVVKVLFFVPFLVGFAAAPAFLALGVALCLIMNVFMGLACPGRVFLQAREISSSSLGATFQLVRLSLIQAVDDVREVEGFANTLTPKTCRFRLCLCPWAREALEEERSVHGNANNHVQHNNNSNHHQGSTGFDSSSASSVAGDVPAAGSGWRERAPAPIQVAGGAEHSAPGRILSAQGGVDSPTTPAGYVALASRVWDSFISCCEFAAERAISHGVVPLDDVESLEPYIVIGVPALVQYRAAKRSADFFRGLGDPPEVIFLADGTPLPLPPRSLRHYRRLFQPMIRARDLILDLDPSPREDAYLQAMLLLGSGESVGYLIEGAASAGSPRGGSRSPRTPDPQQQQQQGNDDRGFVSIDIVDAPASEPRTNALADIDDESGKTDTARRVKELHAAAAVLQSVATDITRLPPFKRRFGQAMSQAAAGAALQNVPTRTLIIPPPTTPMVTGGGGRPGRDGDPDAGRDIGDGQDENDVRTPVLRSDDPDGTGAAAPSHITGDPWLDFAHEWM